MHFLPLAGKPVQAHIFQYKHTHAGKTQNRNESNHKDLWPARQIYGYILFWSLTDLWQLMRALTSGTLTRVCREERECSAVLWFASRLRASLTPEVTTLIFRSTWSSWTNGRTSHWWRSTPPSTTPTGNRPPMPCSSMVRRVFDWLMDWLITDCIIDGLTD